MYIMEYYAAIKGSEVLPFVIAWMDLGGTMLNEMDQTGKDKYHMISFTCAI